MESGLPSFIHTLWLWRNRLLGLHTMLGVLSKKRSECQNNSSRPIEDASLENCFLSQSSQTPKVPCHQQSPMLSVTLKPFMLLLLVSWPSSPPDLFLPLFLDINFLLSIHLNVSTLRSHHLTCQKYILKEKAEETGLQQEDRKGGRRERREGIRHYFRGMMTLNILTLELANSF